MTALTLKLTAQEAALLTTLVSDQMFRREFIDPKFPGHRANHGDLVLGKSLVTRLRALVNQPISKKPGDIRVAQ